MKIKQLFVAALAATTLFASCSKENNNETTKETTQLSVKISGVVKSRAVEAPGETTQGTIQLTNGHIFVINPLGAVIYDEALVVADATGAGQVLGQSVPADSRVYIIGNIPSADVTTIAGLATFDAIKTQTSAMTTQTDYTEAALANSDGLPASITVATTTATVDVSIKPLISRLELAQLKGGANTAGDAITAFTVTGVFVDSYYPSFTYIGGNSGTIFDQATSATFTGIGDAGTWAASGTPLVAAPASGNVWAYNVASGGIAPLIPRFIIRLSGVKYTPNGGTEIDLGTTSYYLTVTDYKVSGVSVPAFERGKIYRIGAANGITFTPDDLALTPNPVDIDLTVNVSIDEWELVTPDAVLQ